MARVFDSLLGIFGTAAGAITGFVGGHALTGLIVSFGFPLLAAAGASAAAGVVAGIVLDRLLGRYSGFFSGLGYGLACGALVSAAQDINLFGLFNHQGASLGQDPSPPWWKRPIGPS